MPTLLESLSLRGVRSYSPLIDSTQSIQFSPLTLILGPNGSGKTTIIEALKFLMSGEEPPLSDSRRNFIHFPAKKVANSVKSYAEMELKFKASDSNTYFARREIFLPPPGKTSTPAVQSCYRINDKGWKYINKQDEWGRTIVKFFDLPNSAVINNVILCHQENSLWPFSEYSHVKEVLDKIFGCERYKKEVKYIETEIKNSKKNLEFLGTALTRDIEISSQKKQFAIDRDSRIAELSLTLSDIKRIEKNIALMESDLNFLMKDISETQQTHDKLSILKAKLTEKDSIKKNWEERLGSELMDCGAISDQELESKIENHHSFVKNLQLRREQLEEKTKDFRTKRQTLVRSEETLKKDINNIKLVEMILDKTSSNIKRQLSTIKEIYDLEDLDIDSDFDEMLENMKKHETKLYSIRTDLTESERGICVQCSELEKSQVSLKIKLRDIDHRLASLKESDRTIKVHLDKADPVTKDLLKVINKFEKMTLITREIADAEIADDLKLLISDSKNIIESIVEKNNAELVQSQKCLEKNAKSLIENESLLEKIKFEKSDVEQKFESSKKELEDVRNSEKRAQNKAIQFRCYAQEIRLLVNQHKAEQKNLLNHNIDTKNEELQAIKEDIEKNELELNNLRVEETQISKEIQDSYEELNKSRQNLEYRRVLKNIREYSSMMDDLDKDKNLLNRYKDLLEKKDSLQVTHRRECERRASVLTKKQQLEVEIKQLESNLTRYASSFRNLARTYGKIACIKIFLHDLEKLKDCFEKSVSSFHNQMIKKINELLRVRWRQIYQGRDIESIELVAEKVQKGEKENYTYYIAMRKGSSLTKMREQSSAGQKALASVIIRMTLAELFVKDFAFIAFDEPTSNLDSANIIALAKAISNYVRRRHNKGANIQWIIITHDEEFVKALSDEISSHYYKISKDAEGSSIIKKASCCAFPDSQET